MTTKENPENPRKQKQSGKNKSTLHSTEYNSSKIERILIELHDYSYYHGPSDLENPDNRFIGREKEIDKLKSELTDTTRKSGAYLVTGYRGMGKTSYINKVLEQLIMPFKPYSSILNLLGLSFVSMLLTFLIYFISITVEKKGFHDFLVAAGGVTMVILVFVYLVIMTLIIIKQRSLGKREEGRFFKSDTIKAIFNAIILTLNPTALHNVKHLKNLIVLLYLLGIVLASFVFLQKPEVVHADLRTVFYYYFIVFLLQCLFVIVLSWFDFKLVESRSGKPAGKDPSGKRPKPLLSELKSIILP